MSQQSTHHVPSTDEAVKARKEAVHVENHGHSPAAWTGVVICLVGALVAGIGIMIGWAAVWLTVVGFVLMAVSGLVTILMSKAGLGGAQPHPDAPDHAGRRVR